MGSVLLQSSRPSRVAFCGDVPKGDEDLGFVRHQLDALAYARAVGGLRPRDEIEYDRLCERERAMLDEIRGSSAQHVA